ncbi:MAG: family 43 glycosylhydrolase [Defluviitaleaceae bacterium]|nr:family 43 glycosylhydrolase [Defluviitaleaceae bacterium]
MTRYICNPLPLPYRYQVKHCGENDVRMFREAADPTLIRFKDMFYMFVSMSGGFWYSKDLYEWTFKETPELPNYDYAPDVHEVNGRVIFSASRGDKPCTFYASGDPLIEPFAEVASPFVFWDPALFQDDDGRVYFYWGCGNEHPLWGVEMNADTFGPLGEKVAVMKAQHDIHGWERIGENNQNPHDHPYIEGAFVNKVNGKYYLQYSAPGTEFNVYANGVYVADTPLGPFEYQKHNPFSSRPGGFITAAGHGSTVQDFDGNWWHIASMRISVNEIFERRLGLFPCDFDADGVKHCNQHFADYPYALPKGKRGDMGRTAPEWNLLSYGKKATASSYQAGYELDKGTNEDICTWWAADRGDLSPWYQLDLGRVYKVHAVQVNFADHVLTPPSDWDANPQSVVYGRRIYNDSGELSFLLEGSANGDEWITLKDTRHAAQDNPHDLIVQREAADFRYIRISHISHAVDGAVAISGLRVFGAGNGMPPAKVKAVEAKRSDEGMDVSLSWPPIDGADGYNVRYGIAADKLYNSWQLFGKNELNLSFLSKGTEYYIAVDGFNENGVTAGEILKV